MVHEQCVLQYVEADLNKKSLKPKDHHSCAQHEKAKIEILEEPIWNAKPIYKIAV